jgi:cardiolipin synthase
MTGLVLPLGEGGQALVDRAMDRVAGGRPVPGNKVELLFDGPQVYPAMLERIAAAEHWIHLDNYIIRGDRTGRQFVDALAERARSGVRVRVLTDWFGSWTTKRRLWDDLRAAGGEVRYFQPPDFLRPFRNLTRDHRKLLVVDGRRGVTGGLCLGDEWAGDAARDQQPWRDTGLSVDGPAAGVLDRAFATVWGRIGAALPEDELAADVPAFGDVGVRIVAGEPGGVRASRTTELLLAGAAERVWLTDAYLVAPRGIYRALLDAAAEGVDVRLLVPGTSDLPHVRNLTRTGYRELLRSGVRIFEWHGPMLHAKTIVVDGRWSRIGSTNMNVSSLIANFELDVLVDHIDIARQLEAQFRKDLDRSAEVLLRRSRFRSSLQFRPPEASPGLHILGRRERRRQRVVTLRAVMGGSQRALLTQASLLATVIAALLFFFPRTMGLIFGTLTLYFFLTSLYGAWSQSRRVERGRRAAGQ